MTVHLSGDALRALGQLLPARQLVTDPVALLTYEGDAGMDRARPDGVALPVSADEVARIARWSTAYRIPLIARGAGTGLSGGAVAEHGGIILQFARMSQVIELDEGGRTAVVQPGLVNQDLDLLCKSRGLYFPPDPSSGRAATLGGNIAENSGGPHCFKYGVTTNYVSGLEVVLADGQQVRLGGRALDYPEYDLVGIVTGSEGTLAIVTAASLRLLRNPPAVKTLMAAFDSVEQAGEAVSAVIARGLVPTTLEMMDQKMMQIIEAFTHGGLPVEAGAALIIEADGYPDSVGPQIEAIAAILQQHNLRELRIAQTAQERDTIWYGRKSAVGAMSRLAPAYYLVDVTVPRSKLAPMLAGVNQICEQLGLRVGYVFHAGDGNLHPLILIENPADKELMARVLDAGRRIVELCVSFDGSITGEHGVGIEKRAYMPLMYSKAELELMLAIKHVFDPHHLLNPGKIFPEVTGDRLQVTGEQRAGSTPPATPNRAIAEQGVVQPGAAGATPTERELQMLHPSSVEQAAEALRDLTAAGKAMRICGGGTKSGLLPPAAVTLCTDALCGVRSFARDDLALTVAAGTPLAILQRELADGGMWTPLASPWPQATIGGIVATSYNAPLRMRYGGIRDLLLAATLVLPDGQVIRAGRPVVKNVAGYDLPKLFAGSHGTLGLLTELTLKLVPLPPARASLVVPVEDLTQGLTLGARLLPVCLVASALLLCDSAALGELAPATRYALVYTAEGPSEDVRAELTQAQAALRAVGVNGAKLVDDLAGSVVWGHWLGKSKGQGAQAGTTLRLGLPVKELPSLLSCYVDQLAAQAELLADLANGLVYLRGALDVLALRAEALAAGGYAVVLNAAHALPPSAIWGEAAPSNRLMRGLKAQLDPAGLLNPGVFVV